MAIVFLTSASGTSWTRPTNWSDAGHTVRLVGCGGRGGTGTTGTSYRSGPGGGGGAHVLLTRTAGALASTVPFRVTSDNSSVTDRTTNSATLWGASTFANTYYVESGEGGGVGGTDTAGGIGGSATTTSTGSPTVSTYTASLGNAGGTGGAVAAVLASAGGGGGAGGPSGVGGTGGACTTASFGGGGGGANNGGGNAANASTANGTQGGNTGGAGGVSGTPGGGAGGTGTGKGGGGGFFSAAVVNSSGGAGGDEDLYTQTSDSALAGPGGGGGGGGACSLNATGHTSSGGIGAAYGGGGGGAGGTRSTTSTRTAGAGASGLIVITYTGLELLAATEGADVSSFSGSVPVTIAVRSTSTTPYAARTNITVNKPAGTADGDFLVAFISLGGGIPMAWGALPSGWTLAKTYTPIYDGGVFYVETRVYTKFASGEGASWTWNTDNRASEGTVIALTGVTGTNASILLSPISEQFASGAGNSGWIATAPEVTTSTDGALVLFFDQNWGENTGLAPPTGDNPTFTELVDYPTAGLTYIAAGVKTTAGATGGKAQLLSASAGQPWLGSLVSVNPSEVALPSSLPVSNKFDSGRGLLTFTNNNLDAAGAGSTWQNVKGTLGKSTGKWYFEFKILAAGVSPAYWHIGISDSGDTPYGLYVGNWNNSGGCDTNGSQWTTGFTNVAPSVSCAGVANDVFGIAVDIDAKKVWLSKNGVFQASGNPATGANPWMTWTAAYTIYPALSIYQAGPALRYSGDANNSYNPPAGFSLWSDIRLAATGSADVAAFNESSAGVTGSFAIISGADTAIIVGGIVATGALAVTEATDASAIVGSVASAGITGTLAVTETVDIAAIAGGIVATGTLAVTEVVDTAAVAGSVVGAGISGSLSVIEAADTCSITSAWSIFTTQIPVTNVNNDGPYEMGMLFKSSVPGKITAIRFYKEATEGTGHTGNIWLNSTQALLTSVAFSGEASSGWVTQYLPTPLDIAADTLYMVSVNNAGQHYVATNNGLDAPGVSNGPLTTDGVPNGFFGTPGTFPTGTYLNTNYFRDIIFYPSVVATGTFAVTEAVDTAAVAGSIVGAGISGNLSVTEAADVAAIAGQVTGVAGTLAAAEAADTASVGGSTYWLGALAATELGDTSAIAGGLFATGTLAAAESVDSSVVTGIVVSAGPLTATESIDIAGFMGVAGAGLIAALAVTEAPDATTFSGQVTGVAGVLAATEPAKDTAFGAGLVAWLAALAATELGDTASIAATSRTLGTLAAVEAGDTATGTGLVYWLGALAAVEAKDAASLAGVTYWSGTLAATEVGDTAVGIGQVRWIATLAAVEASDITVASGFAQGYGSLSAPEQYDQANIAAFARTNGIITAIEAADSAEVRALTGLGGDLAAQDVVDIADIHAQIVYPNTLVAWEGSDIVSMTGGEIRTSHITGRKDRSRSILGRKRPINVVAHQ